MTFAHCAPAFSDPPRGRQPFLSASGVTARVLNGEIYNHAELRHALPAAGTALRTDSYTEVVVELVELYERHGLDMLHRVRGMFAFAPHDTRAGTLVLARDPAGSLWQSPPVRLNEPLPVRGRRRSGESFLTHHVRKTMARGFRPTPPWSVPVRQVLPDGTTVASGARSPSRKEQLDALLERVARRSRPIRTPPGAFRRHAGVVGAGGGRSVRQLRALLRRAADRLPALGLRGLSLPGPGKPRTLNAAIDVAELPGCAGVGCVEVLQVLGEHSPARISDLAARRLAPSTVSGLIGQMITSGLVARDMDSADRRASVVTLTDAGREKLAAWTTPTNAVSTARWPPSTTAPGRPSRTHCPLRSSSPSTSASRPTAPRRTDRSGDQPESGTPPESGTRPVSGLAEADESGR
ncbi:hypothetical protein [Streptomyces roseochromogenus]|uniref:hypothetical protein n=1 Tax=Streptomyces roseochromogenus TaxID=285450 RepID=UPI001FD7EE97|nr:hypothetical protein [Streptomyces roseochromogenus]